MLTIERFLGSSSPFHHLPLPVPSWGYRPNHKESVRTKDFRKPEIQPDINKHFVHTTQLTWKLFWFAKCCILVTAQCCKTTNFYLPPQKKLALRASEYRKTKFLWTLKAWGLSVVLITTGTTLIRIMSLERRALIVTLCLESICLHPLHRNLNMFCSPSSKLLILVSVAGILVHIFSLLFELL